jgi:hypothetical protein
LAQETPPLPQLVSILTFLVRRYSGGGPQRRRKNRAITLALGETLMSQYLLLLYDDPAAVKQWRKLGPEEIQKGIQQYVDWTNRARQSGFYVASNKLADDAGRVVRSHSGKHRVTDGPFAESKELLGGYYIIEASSYEQAVQRIQDHPHLAHGGTIELRQIEPLR